MKLRIFPVILSALLLAAHFLRSFSLLAMLLCLAAPLLLLIKRSWILRVMQILCAVSTLIWIIALYEIVQQRIYEGRSWTASAIILGVVVAFALLSGWLLNAPEVKNNYL
jgi:hypothetical protein